jgi:ferritin
MISQKLQDAINDQINHELHSAYVYLSMVAYFEDQNLPGFASWMRVQSQEENEHAMKLFDFMNERGGRVVLQKLDQPPVDFKSAEDVFAQAYEHEKYISGTIHKLYEIALAENDYPTQVMLHWFIEEQVEEEDNTSRVLDMVQRAENRAWALLILDNQVGKRKE